MSTNHPPRSPVPLRRSHSTTHLPVRRSAVQIGSHRRRTGRMHDLHGCRHVGRGRVQRRLLLIELREGQRYTTDRRRRRSRAGGKGRLSIAHLGQVQINVASFSRTVCLHLIQMYVPVTNRAINLKWPFSTQKGHRTGSVVFIWGVRGGPPDAQALYHKIPCRDAETDVVPTGCIW